MRQILVLCTGNSARSILAEALFNRLGEGRLAAYSAGSDPKGEPHPEALALLAAEGFDVSGLRSKKWDVFARADAPTLDIVITVCDSAAGEACPIWPGAPVSAHWGIEDPAAASTSEQAAAFKKAYRELSARIEAMLTLPFETMAAGELKAALNSIGAEHAGATEMAKGSVRG